MTDLVGAVHFLVLIGLTGAYIETRIGPWPQWTAPFALLVFLGLILVYAFLVGTAYT
jgi:putative Mn2+ efflux pump MntP